MNPQLARALFPMVLHRLISIHMTNCVLPFAVAHTVTAAYLSTLREVLAPQGAGK